MVAARPTRREKRRVQTVREIKSLAMEQIRQGGPDAVSLSGIVRQMSMSPAAVYRYFQNRDALIADLVIDTYDEFADSLVAVVARAGSAQEKLTAALKGGRVWALEHPNSYRLIFQTHIGSGNDCAVERTLSAASRSMVVLVAVLIGASSTASMGEGLPIEKNELERAIQIWSKRSGHAEVAPSLLMVAMLTWTRLHGIISLELGGHLDAAGLSADLLFDAEIAAVCGSHAQEGGAVAARTLRSR